MGQSGRSRGVKLVGPNDLKCTVLGQSERSKRLKVKGPKGEKLDGLKERNWMVVRNESRRSKRFEVDGLKD